MALTDAEAKAILREKWPRRTRAWPIPAYGGFWVRACPSNTPMPYIHPAGGGQRLRTHPDGMYIFAHIKTAFIDVIAIEVCGTYQNYNDKKARYGPASGNQHVTLPLQWLNSDVVIQRGMSKRYWEASRWFEKAPAGDLTLTIRHQRALFVLRDQDYAVIHNHHLPAAHEYLCRHRDLSQITQQGMRSFIKGMALMKHFRSRV